MTEREFYESIGGSYEEAAGRLMRDSFIRKFVCRFPEDPSFSALETAVAAQAWDDAFAAAHTLKGVVMNLAFTRLSAAAVAVTDALRPQNRESLTPERIAELFAEVKKEYETVLAAIGELT